MKSSKTCLPITNVCLIHLYTKTDEFGYLHSKISYPSQAYMQYYCWLDCILRRGWMNLWIASELENVAVVDCDSNNRQQVSRCLYRLVATRYVNWFTLCMKTSLNLFILMRELGNMEDAGTPFSGQGPLIQATHQHRKKWGLIGFRLCNLAYLKKPCRPQQHLALKIQQNTGDCNGSENQTWLGLHVMK